METPAFIRRHLVKNFPTSFRLSDLVYHFLSDYNKLVGQNAPMIKYKAQSFSSMWKKVKNKETFLTYFSTADAWLDKKIPIAEQTTQKRTPSPGVAKNCRSFKNLTERGKRYRLSSLLKRKPEVDELEFLLKKTKKRRLDLTGKCRHFFDNYSNNFGLLYLRNC
jgi:hypothetical protein